MNRPPSSNPKRTRQALAATAAIFAMAALANGCSAREPPAATPEEATAAPQQYPQDHAGAGAAPDPSVTSGAPDLASEEKNLENAEKQVLAALQNKTVAGDPLDTTDRCTVVCKSIASMQRSAKHICELAADRCNAANERLKSAEQRAKSACPSCGTAG